MYPSYGLEPAATFPKSGLSWKATTSPVSAPDARRNTPRAAWARGRPGASSYGTWPALRYGTPRPSGRAWTRADPARHRMGPGPQSSMGPPDHLDALGPGPTRRVIVWDLARNRVWDPQTIWTRLDPGRRIRPAGRPGGAGRPGRPADPGRVMDGCLSWIGRRGKTGFWWGALRLGRALKFPRGRPSK